MIWIEKSALATLMNDSVKWFPKETGGILLGYVSLKKEYVITALTTAGPQALHEINSYKPDYEYDIEEAKQAFFESDGQVRYLGDWHSHPNAASYLSWKDKKTILNIAQDAEAQLPEPLMLVLGTEPLRLQAWMYKRRGFLNDIYRWQRIKIFSAE